MNKFLKKIAAAIMAVGILFSGAVLDVDAIDASTLPICILGSNSALRCQLRAQVYGATAWSNAHNLGEARSFVEVRVLSTNELRDNSTSTWGTLQSAWAGGFMSGITRANSTHSWRVVAGAPATTVNRSRTTAGTS